jgi:hypothetical protein
MTPLEEELKQAMRRQEPPADFTARVLARCAVDDARRRSVRPQWWLSMAAAVLFTVAGGTMWQQHEREVKGMAAKRQLILAMRIAGTRLQAVQQRVRESEEEQQ